MNCWRIEQPENERPRRSVALRCFVLALLGWAVISIGGVGSVFGPWSQAVIGSIVKFTYPSTGQDDTTVLLFREENLRTFGSAYPVPYSVHADVLAALGTYQPRAVFIDFAFVDERIGDDPETLANAICDLHEQGVEVKLAVAEPEASGFGVLPILLRDGCAVPVDVTLEEPDSDAGLLSYSPGARTSSGDFLASPAFALLPPGLSVTPEDSAAMELVWIPGHAPLNRKWMACGETGFIQTAKKLLTRGPLAMRESCPYTRTISVNHLLNAAGDEDVTGALEGKTVFYGADFRMTGDRVPISLFEELPGVFVHAMAYDNLVSFGSDYKRADRESATSKLFDLALLILSAFVLVRFAPTEIDNLDQFSNRIISTLAATLLIVLATIAGTIFAGAGGGLLAGFMTYVAYRCLIDCAFAIFCLITVVMSFIAYAALDLGPRNVLFFVAFFQLIRTLQERLLRLNDKYAELRARFPSNTIPRCIRWFFDKLQIVV